MAEQTFFKENMRGKLELLIVAKVYQRGLLEGWSRS